MRRASRPQDRHGETSRQYDRAEPQEDPGAKLMPDRGFVRVLGGSIAISAAKAI
jgi:hypothetical protein